MKNSQNTSRLVGLGNNRGQSIIEYTLIMIISVAIVLTLMNAMFKPFGQFVSDYMGKYTACLLEYGELPSFGNTEIPSPADEDSECDKKFKPGTVTQGRPPAGGSSGSSSTRSSSSANSSSTERSSSGGGSTYAGSSSRGGSSSMSRNRRSNGSGTEGGGAKSGKVVEIALNSGANNGFFNGGNNNFSVSGQGSKQRSVGLSGLTETERKKLEKKAAGLNTVIPTDGGLARPQKKLAIKPPVERMIAREEEPWTLGNFIRYLFIAALVIALVIFIGGQALQMSKSGDK